MQIEEPDAGLDDAVTELGIDLENALHARESRASRCRAWRAQTRHNRSSCRARSATAECDDRFAIRTHLLHLLRARCHQRGARRMLDLVARGVQIQIGLAILIRREHVLLAEHAFERGERRAERLPASRPTAE